MTFIMSYFVFLPLALLFGIVLKGGALGAWAGTTVFIIILAAVLFRRFYSESWRGINIFKYSDADEASIESDSGSGKQFRAGTINSSCSAPSSGYSPMKPRWRHRFGCPCSQRSQCQQGIPGSTATRCPGDSDAPTPSCASGPAATTVPENSCPSTSGSRTTVSPMRPSS